VINELFSQKGEKTMGLYQQPGYKRLSIGITVLTFIAFLLFAGETGASLGEALLAGVIFSAGAYVLTRLVYWIIDGFKSHKAEESSDEP
jgi:hypothetical protein